MLRLSHIPVGPNTRSRSAPPSTDRLHDFSFPDLIYCVYYQAFPTRCTQASNSTHMAGSITKDGGLKTDNLSEMRGFLEAP